MNPTVAAPLDDLSLPRRVAVAHLLRTALHTARELARLYAAFAGRTALAPLRGGLVDLARAKAAEVPALESFARVAASALREEEGPVPGVVPVHETGNGRLEDFGSAYRGEQALGVAYREALALAGDPARLPGLADLAAEQRHHQARLRDLYRQYS